MTWHGEKRSNQTHQSRTDPEARLARKSNNTGARLSYAGHVLMENRNGLMVDIQVTEANGWAERETGLEMLKRVARRGVTVGGDKGFDTKASGGIWRQHSSKAFDEVAAPCTGFSHQNQVFLRGDREIVETPKVADV